MALVVEDDPAIRGVVRKYLGKLGLATTEVGTGREAIRWLSEHRPDVVLLDLMLPEQSGYDICEHIRRSLSLDVPIVIMSARWLAEDRAHAEELGANAYIVKPFTMAQFTQAVQTALDDRASR